MNNPTVATRAEWLRARLALLAREKAHTKERDAISAARRALPWVRVDQEYSFDTATGRKDLAQLFGPHSQLIVYHFMFGPAWEAGCKSCSFWADSFDGLAPHFAARDAAFAVVSSAPLDRLERFKARMGWDFTWVSSHGTPFNYDFDVGFDDGRGADRSPAYNFGSLPRAPADEMPGISVFAKGADGTVYHTYSTYGRGLDAANAAYTYLDLTPKGRDEPDGHPMAWVRYHDEYDAHTPEDA